MKKYQKLIGYRNMANITQAEMAEYIAISRVSYGSKENGKVKFTAEDMKKIRDVLSDKLGKPLTIDELFF